MNVTFSSFFNYSQTLPKCHHLWINSIPEEYVEWMNEWVIGGMSYWMNEWMSYYRNELLNELSIEWSIVITFSSSVSLVPPYSGTRILFPTCTFTGCIFPSYIHIIIIIVNYKYKRTLITYCVSLNLTKLKWVFTNNPLSLCVY